MHRILGAGSVILCAHQQQTTQHQLNMKKLVVPSSIALSAILFLSGCVAAIGNRDTRHGGGTIGQQLIDLQKAKDAGAITEAEFQTEKAKLLGDK
jgi:hypothetical protein